MTDTGFPVLQDWVTCSQAADILGISRQSVNRMIVDREFETTHLLGLGERPIYVVKTSEVEQRKQQRAAKTTKKKAAVPEHS